VLDTIDNHYARSWRIHEFVHYLQDLAGRKLDTIFYHRLAEAEAYAVQNQYLKTKGKDPLIANQITPCGRHE